MGLSLLAMSSVTLSPAPSDQDRTQALYLAKLAEQAERYEDMVAYMNRIIDLGTKGDDLTVEERNLLSVGYKNMMSVRRTAWRTIEGHEDQAASEGKTEEKDKTSEYKKHVTEEVYNLINEVTNDI